ncbi:hypothetical protein ABH62_30665, partial [Bacillus cereus]
LGAGGIAVDPGIAGQHADIGRHAPQLARVEAFDTAEVGEAAQHRVLGRDQWRGGTGRGIPAAVEAAGK